MLCRPSAKLVLLRDSSFRCLSERNYVTRCHTCLGSSRPSSCAQLAILGRFWLKGYFPGLRKGVKSSIVLCMLPAPWLIDTARQRSLSQAASMPAPGFFERHDNVLFYVPNLIGAFYRCNMLQQHREASKANQLDPYRAGYARIAATLYALAIAFHQPLACITSYFLS